MIRNPPFHFGAFWILEQILSGNMLLLTSSACCEAPASLQCPAELLMCPLMGKRWRAPRSFCVEHRCRGVTPLLCGGLTLPRCSARAVPPVAPTGFSHCCCRGVKHLLPAGLVGSDSDLRPILRAMPDQVKGCISSRAP